MELDENNNNASNNARSNECCTKRLASRCPSSSQTLQSLYDLRQNNLLCDAVIRLEDGGVFSIHRAILSACSAYFRTLFTTTLHSEKRTDFLIPNVNSHDMNQLLDYAYLHRLDVNKANVCQLLVSADYLDVLGVLELCCDYLKRNLVPENCIGIMLFAREHFCQELEEAARRYICKNFVEIAETSSEILTLCVADLKALISADELNVKNEEDTWELVLRWIDHDPKKRKAHIAELMSQIRLGLLETQYFMENVKEHPYVVRNQACRPMLIEALKFIYELETFSINNEKIATPKIGRPRIPYEILFAIGGWTKDMATNYMETYDTRADRWVKVPQVDPFGPRAHHGSAVIGDNIYVVGGFDGHSFFNSCRRFNVVTKIWREVAPMNFRRCYVSVTVLNDLVYAMGGFDGLHRLSSAERYDYRRNQWSLIAPMRYQRSDGDCTTLDGKIYVAGGCNSAGELLNTAEYYDPRTNQWTLIAPMRSRRCSLRCIAYHGSVYAIGGYNGISSVTVAERYDPKNNMWIRTPDMYTPRRNFALEVIDDRIFAIGGFANYSTSHVECYDDETNQWYKADDMWVNRSGLSACVLVDPPNVHDYLHNRREQLLEENRQRQTKSNLNQ
ncbi:kelch-like protein 10 [Phymastichus coffea]|uniref:kelch-like protein 10 n=1 Tax=Phymastichus coffea TaxID=108790 RepID=UPI00273B2EC6|nr:kelch-like protein 10 [Phymastichus coffea]